MDDRIRLDRALLNAAHVLPWTQRVFVDTWLAAVGKRLLTGHDEGTNEIEWRHEVQRCVRLERARQRRQDAEAVVEAWKVKAKAQEAKR